MTAPSLPGRTDPSLSGGTSPSGGDFSSGGTSSLLGGTPSLLRGTLTEGELSSSASVTSSLELISQSPWPVASQGGDLLGQQTVTPPCFPIAGDEKLGPRHLDRKFLITSGFEASVSCKKTNSA